MLKPPTPEVPNEASRPTFAAPPEGRLEAEPGSPWIQRAAVVMRWVPQDALETPTFVWFAMSIGTMVFAVAAGSEWTGMIGLFLFGLAMVIAFYRGTHGLVRLVAAVRRNGPYAEAFRATLGNYFMLGLGMMIVRLATMGFARGRQVRRLGRVILPPLIPSSSWAHVNVAVDIHEPPPEGLASQWRENGRTEHASVAAFARLTLDLLSLKAPLRLVQGAQQDALDEIRHTELCFALCQALDGRQIGPGPFRGADRAFRWQPSRALSLASLAVDSLVDGALHEGVSARIIARLAQRCDIPGIRAVLKEIAADEGRHSAHGWAVVQWCLDEGGAAVAQALLGAVHALPAKMQSPLPVPAMEGGWERWGIHGLALEEQEYEAAREHVKQRVRDMVASAARARRQVQAA